MIICASPYICILLSMYIYKLEITRSVYTNILICSFKISNFKQYSCFYIHFQTNSLFKGMNPLILQTMG